MTRRWCTKWCSEERGTTQGLRLRYYKVIRSLYAVSSDYWSPRPFTTHLGCSPCGSTWLRPRSRRLIFAAWLFAIADLRPLHFVLQPSATAPYAPCKTSIASPASMSLHSSRKGAIPCTAAAAPPSACTFADAVSTTSIDVDRGSRLDSFRVEIEANYGSVLLSAGLAPLGRHPPILSRSGATSDARCRGRRERIEAEGGRWGRPRRMDRQVIDRARTTRTKGASLREIAVALKIPRTTLARTLASP